MSKPIARLYISHEHADHCFGAGVFGAPVYALAEIKDKIDARGDEQLRCTPSSATSSRRKRPTEQVVEPGQETIDDAVFECGRIEGADSASSLTIGLPDGVLITQDWTRPVSVDRGFLGGLGSCCRCLDFSIYRREPRSGAARTVSRQRAVLELHR